MKRIRRALIRLWGDQRGVALALSLMALLVLSVLAATLVTVGSSEVQIATNHLRGTQALFLAEAGLEDAYNALKATPNLVRTAPNSLTAVPGISGTSLAPYGTYDAQYQTSGLNTVLVVATGTNGNGGAAQVIRAIMTTQFATDAAFTSSGDLLVDTSSGGISGACGNVHANGDLTVDGATISGDATATGVYTEIATPTIGGVSGGGLPAQPVPTIDPLATLAIAKSTLPANEVFQLKADGTVLDGNDTVIGSSPFNGWKLTGQTWKISLSLGSHVDGTYFAEGDAQISDDGTWNATIIATGNIKQVGATVLTPHLPDTLLVAGMDIRLGGSAGSAFEGFIAAHEQIGIQGSPDIVGALLAEDAAAVSNIVTSTYISNNATVTYGCGLTAAILVPLYIAAWGL